MVFNCKGDPSTEPDLGALSFLNVSTRVVVGADLPYTQPRARCTSLLLDPNLGGGEAEEAQWQVVVVPPQQEGAILDSPTQAL